MEIGRQNTLSGKKIIIVAFSLESIFIRAYKFGYFLNIYKKKKERINT